MKRRTAIRNLWTCIYMALMCVLFLQSCSNGAGKEAVRDEQFETCQFGVSRIWLEQKSDSLSVVYLSIEDCVADSLVLPYPVYRLSCGDLNDDGRPEVCVGVIKSTKYWKKAEKRLFIYHLYLGRYIRPLWLGSRVGHTLEDFRLCRDSLPARVLTQEWDEKRQEKLYGQYRLQGFGLQFEKYIQQNKLFLKTNYYEDEED